MLRDLRIRMAQPGDGGAVGAILEQCGLPADDCLRLLPDFHVASFDSAVVGCAAAERFGDTAVVCSVAVLPAYREQGVATHLVRAVLMRARANGARRAVVLTASMPTYFARYGFSLIAADKLPREVLESTEFLRQGASCPLYMYCDLK